MLLAINKKIYIVIIVIVAVSIIGTIILSSALSNQGNTLPTGTLMFQSNVAGVTVTILGPNETLRMGVIGENRQVSFTGLPNGNYTGIATKDGYFPSDIYGMSIKNGGTSTATFSLQEIPSEQVLRLSTNPAAIIIKQGNSGTVMFNISSPRDYAGAVSFIFESYYQHAGYTWSGGLPPGVTALFDPTSVTVAVGGNASSILTLAVSPTAPKGVYTMVVETIYEYGGIVGFGMLLQVA